LCHSLSISLSQSLYISVSISYLLNTSLVNVVVDGDAAVVVTVAPPHYIGDVANDVAHDHDVVVVVVGDDVAYAVAFCICGSW
jgi:hypothetical protein